MHRVLGLFNHRFRGIPSYIAIIDYEMGAKLTHLPIALFFRDTSRHGMRNQISLGAYVGPDVFQCTN